MSVWVHINNADGEVTDYINTSHITRIAKSATGSTIHFIHGSRHEVNVSPEKLRAAIKDAV